MGAGIEMTPRRQLAARALVLVALAGAARADVNASVVVSAEPAALVVETDLRATLNIEVGTEVTPSVTASVGRVENVRALGGGRFTADYLPPREAYPQVAIVAVLSGERCGWTSIPLVGQGVAIARSVPESTCWRRGPPRRPMRPRRSRSSRSRSPPGACRSRGRA